TAKHCLEGLAPANVTVRMGSQSRNVLSWVKNPSWDVAMMKRSSGMTMPNWNRTGFPLGFPINTTTGYRRTVTALSNAQLNGRTLTCYGYGPGLASPPFRTARLTSTHNPSSEAPPPKKPHH